jgi:acyl carrier protein
MNRNELRELVIAELGNIAPEFDAAQIDPDADLREVLDIDSLDFQNFLSAVHKKTGISVPEGDYGKLTTLNSALTYLASSSK